MSRRLMIVLIARVRTAGGYRVATETGAGKVDVTVEQSEGGSRAIIASTGAGNIRIHPR